MGDHDESGEEYKVPMKVGLDQLLDKDKDDIALENYKKSLLGSTVYAPPDDPRRVVIVEMHIIFEDRPGGDVVFKGLDKEEALEKLKNTSIVFKEKSKYRLKIVFRVQHDIVTGLKYRNKLYKAGIKATCEELMLGSYPPQIQTHEVIWPHHGWEETPSGMLVRGKYKSAIEFVDDDKVKHLEFQYQFYIKSDWESDKNDD